MARVLARVVVAVAFFFTATVSADEPALRWSRSVDVAEGWARLVLPDDVLAACRPGLPDLRVRGKDGSDVPYVVEQSLGGVPTEWVARNVESVPGRETTAIIDRGLHPALASEATIDVAAVDFLKPIVVEASDDAADWKEIARGSIFGAESGRARARMTTVRFAPNDRRYWRLRLDDRNGPAVSPRSVRASALKSDAAPPRTIALDVKRSGDGASAPGAARSTLGESGVSTYEITLPSANLSIASLRLEATDPAFVRRATVSERVLARDEITRRDVGGGTIARSPAGDSLVVPLGELRGPTLEIRIEDGGSPPLTLAHATATLAPRSLLFYAVGGALPLTLAYGSATLDAPRFDMAAVLARGRPDPIALGRLGDAVDHGATSPVGLPPHGLEVDASRWRTRAAIDLPPAGGVTYLALDGIDPSAGLRIVDGSSKEVPYLFERAAHRAREKARSTVAHSPGRTVVTLTDLASLRELDALELTASAPDYFVRRVTVVEAVRDARGPVGERALGAATWERRPGEPATPLTVSIGVPSQPTIEVRIDDGDNPPLSLGDVTVEREIRRIDFVSAPGESLALLTGNPGATQPQYDLALLAGTLLSAPAQPAHLQPAQDIAPPESGPPKWFWAVVVVAGLACGGVLARTMAKST